MIRLNNGVDDKSAPEASSGPSDGSANQSQISCRAAAMKCLLVLLELLLFYVSESHPELLSPLEISARSEFNRKVQAQILLNVNASVSPCDDFYGFACGNFAENHREASAHAEDMAGYLRNEHLKQLRSALAANRHREGVYQQLWSYHSACTRQKSPSSVEFTKRVASELQRDGTARPMAKLGPYGLRDVFISNQVRRRRPCPKYTPGRDHQRLLEEYFVLKSLDENKEAAAYRAKKLAEHYMEFLVFQVNLHCSEYISETHRQRLPNITDEEAIRIFFGADDYTADRLMPHLLRILYEQGQGERTGLPEWILQIGPQTSPPLDEHAVIGDLMDVVGVGEEEAENLAADVMHLEWRLGNLTQQQEQRTRPAVGDMKSGLGRMYSVYQLQQKMPQMEWNLYLAQLLGYEPADEQLVVVLNGLDRDYIRNLTDILLGSSDETVAYYLMLKLLPKFATKIRRWPSGSVSLDCMSDLQQDMDLATSYLFEKSYYEARRNATDASLKSLVEKIMAKFEQLFDENYLGLNDEEKAYMRDKLRANLPIRTGNLPQNITYEQVSDYYKDLQLQGADYYDSKLQLLRFEARRKMVLLSGKPGPFPRHEYDLLPVQPNVPTRLSTGALMVPLESLWPLQYDARMDEFRRFSQMGYILARQLQYAFDVEGLTRDAANFLNDTGLSIVSNWSGFTKCYSSTMGGSDELLRDSMADIGGLQVAYGAFFENLDTTASQKHSQLIFEHDKYTAEQLFFINAAQGMCSSSSSSNRARSHSVRINQNWPNHEAFTRTFGCTNGQAMYREQKCRLW